MISPLLGRRLRVRSESTLAQLHDVMQSALDGSDIHLHRLRIDGRDNGVNRLGGPEEEVPQDVPAQQAQLESLKWPLWPGDVDRVLQILEDQECDLDASEERSKRAQ